MKRSELRLNRPNRVSSVAVALAASIGLLTIAAATPASAHDAKTEQQGNVDKQNDDRQDREVEACDLISLAKMQAVVPAIRFIDSKRDTTCIGVSTNDKLLIAQGLQESVVLTFTKLNARNRNLPEYKAATGYPQGISQNLLFLNLGITANAAFLYFWVDGMNWTVVEKIEQPNYFVQITMKSRGPLPPAQQTAMFDLARSVAAKTI